MIEFALNEALAVCLARANRAGASQGAEDLARAVYMLWRMVHRANNPNCPCHDCD